MNLLKNLGESFFKFRMQVEPHMRFREAEQRTAEFRRVESSADVYSQMIRTGIILLNVWVILSPRRKLFALVGRSFPTMLIFYCEPAKLPWPRL
jgi:hypothetical protein